MKKSLFFFLSLLLAACGVDGNHFKLEGRILNMNQGEFYVYDQDGMLPAIDTIKVSGGRFVKTFECDREATLMLVFPNFSEQPIFASPGKSVDVEGDASHLKELKVTGTDDNDAMTAFRKQTAQMSPPEVRKAVGKFVEEHPASPVGVYLVRKYFIATAQPDYAEASKFIATMKARQPDNGVLARLATQMEVYANTVKGSRMPSFSATATDGRKVSSADMSNGLAVVCTWASWSYDSSEPLRILARLQRKYGQRLKVLSIAIDGNKEDGRYRMERDSVECPNVCDGRFFNGPVVRALGLTAVPDNIVFKNGRVVSRGLSAKELEQLVEKELK